MRQKVAECSVASHAQNTDLSPNLLNRPACQRVSLDAEAVKTWTVGGSPATDITYHPSAVC